MPNFELVMKNKPHVVILGAGASVQAIPEGDANGKMVSVMAGFLDKLGMRDIINNVKLSKETDNLEDIYSELIEREDNQDLIDTLEKRIFEYFSDFEIPPHPTVYDFLVLSLRKKDVIATFNWDPLLIQAYERVYCITNNLPQLLFLHGNVSLGLCHEHERPGIIGQVCPICGKSYEKTKLIFPIKKKSYEKNPFIKENWKAVEHYMETAFLLTIFGYSAPKTDLAAKELLKKSWGSTDDRNFEEVEIIDIKEEEYLIETWKDFIHTHHYETEKSFFNSNIARFPRRSCEAEFDRLFNLKWLDGEKGFEPGMNFEDIKKYINKVLRDEESNKEMLTNFYLRH